MQYSLVMHRLLALSGLLLLTGHSTNSESISSFFEIHQGFYLSGHVISKCFGGYFECGLRCLRNDRCQSYSCLTNGDLHTSPCQLYNETRRSRPQNFRKTTGYTYFDIVPECVSQISTPRILCNQNNGTWDPDQNNCTCHPGYKGIYCQSSKMGFFPSTPGHSCKHILNANDSVGDGEYWIDPENNTNPFKVYCDMTTDGGGWLLVANFTMSSSNAPPDWSAETTYRGISNYQNSRMGITNSAMTQLRTHMPFTQLRFHCSKQQGRAFHVTTALNSTGEAVVQYFSGQTNVLPDSCHSFIRMTDDNSYLAVQCHRWGNDGGHYVGKWGHYNKKGERQMYDHAAFVANLYHWSISGRLWLCDDKVSSNLLQGDFWNVFVR